MAVLTGTVAQRKDGGGTDMDPIAFPILAGTVLNEAVRFLFDRAGAVLDRRSGRTPLEEPDQVSGHSELFRVQPSELTDGRVERLTQAHGALGVFLSHPDLLRGDNPELRELLGRLRTDLEAVYGRSLPFGEELSARPGVEAVQRSEHVRGRQVGVRAQGISAAGRARVEQEARIIDDSGEQVGFEIEGQIG
ncbi:hypothetical protein ACPA54_03420 [Uniformispora flossi]|uniref:hypothetical protein n=1 Tax=Uniformispora flossi TaxID=3390723 RepID=UPI003C308D29